MINEIKISLHPTDGLIFFKGTAGKPTKKSFSEINEGNFDNSNFISASFNLTNTQLWKNIELTDKEDKVAEVLQIIEPNIVRVSVNEADGSAKVRLKNSPSPSPSKTSAKA